MVPAESSRTKRKVTLHEKYLTVKIGFKPVTCMSITPAVQKKSATVGVAFLGPVVPFYRLGSELTLYWLGCLMAVSSSFSIKGAVRQKKITLLHNHCVNY